LDGFFFVSEFESSKPVNNARDMWETFRTNSRNKSQSPINLQIILVTQINLRLNRAQVWAFPTRPKHSSCESSRYYKIKPP
jgi:hypothetical protein